MKNLTASILLLSIVSCTSLPKDHFGILVDKQTEDKVVGFSNNRKVIVSSKEAIIIFKYQQIQTVEFLFPN